MKKLLLLLLCTTSMWGQSFFDTTIGGGVTKIDNKIEPFGGMELRYSLPIPYISKLWVSPSVRFDIVGYEYEMTPSFTIGGTYSPKDWIMITGGVFTKDTWYDYFVRTDIKIIGTEEGWIGGTVNVYDNKVLFGITFKDFLNKEL